MSSVAYQDRRRLLESAKDVEVAQAAGAALTEDAALAEAWSAWVGRLGGAREGLVKAIQRSGREQAETSEATAVFHARFEALVEEYGYERERSRVALLVHRPGERPSREEEARREAAWQRAFGQVPSALGRLGARRGLGEVELAVKAIESAPELAAVVDVARLREALAQCVAADAARSAEQREDQEATAEVVAAREALDRTHRGYALFVEAVLTLEGRAEELGRWLYAHDAAYRARQRRPRPEGDGGAPDDDAAEPTGPAG